MEQSEAKRRHTRYLAACLLALAVLLSFLGYYMQKYSDGIHQNIRASTTKSVTALTSDRVKTLDKTLAFLEAQARALAEYLSTPELTVTQELLRTFADLDEEFLHVAAFDAGGRGLSSEGERVEVSPDDEVYRQVFSGNSGVTDTFLGAMGYEEVRAYAPIRRDGKVVGGVFLDLDAEVLRSAGRSPLYDSAGYSYLLKRDGTILLSPASYSYAQIYHNMRDILSFSKSKPETVDAFMAALESGDSGNAVLDFSGEEQIICFEPSAVKEGWYYISVLPLALVEENGQAVVRLSSQMVTMFIAVVLVFLTFLGAVLFFLLRDKWKQEVNEGRIYKAISENIDTAIFLMDRQTRHIRFAFENMDAILGVPVEQVEGHTFSPEWLARAGLPAQVAGMVERVEASAQPAREELLRRDPRLGREVWLSVSVSPLNLKGRGEYMVAFTDVTETRRLMEQLRESMLEAQSASAAKSSFLANMSHDIRTPMNAITGMTDIAMRSIEDRGRVLDCLQKISMSSRQLKGLINDILDMSKIESGKLSLNPGVVSLPEVLEGLVNVVQFQAAEKNQRLFLPILHVAHESVLCDAVRLNQVLMNITANAVKFTPEGGTIRCALAEISSPMGAGYGRYIFTVSDTGIGMSREFQKTIFETFTREKNTQIEKTEGSGLGMSISKWIVDKMGGSIEVDSEPGRGSRFVITVDFPLAEGGAPCPVPHGLSLLLCDPDGQSLESGAATLEALGFRVEAAPGGDAALERCAARRFDVVILRSSRPEPAYFETIANVRRAAPGALLLAAAGDFADVREQALSAGADGMISPLFFRSILARDLSRTLSHAAADAEPLSVEQPLEGCRVLLAEDNALNREIATELLAFSGASVDTVENGRECLERFTASDPGGYRIILMDVRMPVMDGYEATRRIRASGHADAASIPILAVTADAFSEDIEAALAAGMNGHISKPLDMAQVIAEIKKRM